jgi:hypothetical protein
MSGSTKAVRVESMAFSLLLRSERIGKDPSEARKPQLVGELGWRWRLEVPASAAGRMTGCGERVALSIRDPGNGSDDQLYRNEQTYQERNQ